MRLTLRLLGLDLIDFEFNTDAPAEEEADEGAELAGGTTGCTPIGFVAAFEQPDMVGLPDRWGDEG